MKITSAQTENYTADKARRSFPVTDENARSLKPRFVEQYVRDMASGFWVSNPMAPVCVVTLPDGTEILANGNHRVEALRSTPRAVDIFVIRAKMTKDEYAKCLASVDIGAARSYSDAKPLIGLANTQTVSYCLRLEDVQETGPAEYGRIKHSPFAMKAFQLANEENLNLAIETIKEIKPILGKARISYASLGATFFHALENGWTTETLKGFASALTDAWLEMVQRGAEYASIGQKGSSRQPALKQQYILDCLVAFGDNDDLPVDIDTELREDGLYLGRIADPL